MKRFILLLISALLLFTTACSSSIPPVEIPTDDAYHPETDNPYYMNQRAAQCSVAQTENGYYFLLNSMLLYMDEDSQEPIPVCDKPNCLHHESTTATAVAECNAFFELNNASSVFYYAGEVYVFHKRFQSGSSFSLKDADRYQLTLISADGSRRQTVWDLNLTGKSPMIAIIHRGYFYLVTQYANEQGKSVAQLWAYSLHEPGQEPQLLYESDERDFTHNIVNCMYAYGNLFYLEEFLNSATSSERIKSLRILNLTTNEWTIPASPEGYILMGSAISDGKLVRTYQPGGVTNALTPEGEKPDWTSPMLISDLDGSNAEEIAFDSWGRTAADDTFIYVRDPMFFDERAFKTSVMTDYLNIYDVQMNLIDRLPLETLTYNEQLAILTIWPTNGEKILLQAWQIGGRHAIYYINRSEIGSGNITPKEILIYDPAIYSLANRGLY